MKQAETLAAATGQDMARDEAERVRAQAELALGDPARAHSCACAVMSRAGERGSALLVAESSAVAACALRRLGRYEEAQRGRAATVAGFEALGARTLLQQFEQSWEAASKA